MNRKELKKIIQIKDTKQLYHEIYKVYNQELQKLKIDLELLEKCKYNLDDNYKTFKDYIYITKQSRYFSIEYWNIRKYLFKNESVNKKFKMVNSCYPGVCFVNYLNKVKNNIKKIRKMLRELNEDYDLYNNVYKTIFVDNIKNLNLLEYSEEIFD